MSSISPTAPLSLARLPLTLSLDALVPVLMTTSSCSMWPLFLTLKETLPAETLLGEGETLNSLTVTVVDFEAASELVAPAMAAMTAASAARRPRRPTRRCEMENMGGTTQTHPSGSDAHENPSGNSHQIPSK